MTNTQQIDPMPVIMGAAEYPGNLVEKMRAAGAKVDALDCLSLASQAGILSSEPEAAAIHVLEESFTRSSVLREAAKKASAEFTLFYTRRTELSLVHYALERMLQIAEDTGAAMLYADRFIGCINSSLRISLIVGVGIKSAIMLLLSVNHSITMLRQ